MNNKTLRFAGIMALEAMIEPREDARVELRMAEKELKSIRKQFGVR